MNIQCPKCKSKYKIDSSVVPEKGKNIECARCHNIFLVSRKEEAEGIEKVVNNLKENLEEWDKRLMKREKEEKEIRFDLGEEKDLAETSDIKDEEMEKMFRDVLEDMEKKDEEETIETRDEEVEHTENLKDEKEVDEEKPGVDEEIEETAEKTQEEPIQEIKEEDMVSGESTEDRADPDISDISIKETGKEEIRELLEEAKEIAETALEEKPDIEEKIEKRPEKTPEELTQEIKEEEEEEEITTEFQEWEENLDKTEKETLTEETGAPAETRIETNETPQDEEKPGVDEKTEETPEKTQEEPIQEIKEEEAITAESQEQEADPDKTEKETFTEEIKEPAEARIETNETPQDEEKPGTEEKIEETTEKTPEELTQEIKKQDKEKSTILSKLIPYISYLTRVKKLLFKPGKTSEKTGKIRKTPSLLMSTVAAIALIILMAGGYYTIKNIFSSEQTDVMIKSEGEIIPGDPVTKDEKSAPETGDKTSSSTQETKEPLPAPAEDDKKTTSGMPESDSLIVKIGSIIPITYDAEKTKIMSMIIKLKMDTDETAREARNNIPIFEEIIEEAVDAFFKDSFYEDIHFVQDKLKDAITAQLNKSLQRG
ncbi:MAG: zinc-ribbon domain-containing protein, partial [Candidatus Scalindua sp.]